ncbi:unnamed protein product [Microthlaspi erraticum]|uniref:Uncharacterized protein n=1 Tax=Microthlaspi erraticum TaxID=1685480 RepID=A0A6D2KNC3_9BRAS|nr:unnamed protein product [Microthlaspi erraticum]
MSTRPGVLHPSLRILRFTALLGDPVSNKRNKGITLDVGYLSSQVKSRIAQAQTSKLLLARAIARIASGMSAESSISPVALDPHKSTPLAKQGTGDCFSFHSHSMGPPSTHKPTHLCHSSIQPSKKDVLFGWRRRLPQLQGFCPPLNQIRLFRPTTNLKILLPKIHEIASAEANSIQKVAFEPVGSA